MGTCVERAREKNSWICGKTEGEKKEKKKFFITKNS
jgi:hypothetical protein